MQLACVFPSQMLHNSGKEPKASPMESSSQEGEDCAQEEREEAKQALESVSHKALVTEQRKQVALSGSEAAPHNARPRVHLLNILQQGWDLRSVCMLGRCSLLSPAPCSPPCNKGNIRNARRPLPLSAYPGRHTTYSVFSL